MNHYSIFYSWQSEDKARRFAIKKSIENSLGAFTNVELCEATSNRMGSPNIVDSILQNIDEADLFIADITPTYLFAKEGECKKSPNPNVLIELGYAARTLGWERIICIVDGEPEELPFDIKQNRVTKYNNGIQTIITQTITQLMQEPPRIKHDMTIEDRFLTYLYDKKNWNSIDGRQTFFYKIDPSFKIETEPDERDGYEYYMFSQVDSRPHWWIIKLVYNNTVIYETLGIGLDGSRFFTSCPDHTPYKDGFFYSYTEGTMDYALYQFFRQLSNSAYAISSYEAIIPIFKSAHEKEDFLHFLPTQKFPKKTIPCYIPDKLPNGSSGKFYREQYINAFGVIELYKFFQTVYHV